MWECVESKKKFAEKLILKPDTATGFMAEAMNVT
jgi:hypothetical protein